MLPVDKPAGMTSFAVVREIRRALGAPKAGHAGTLDPMATGVLLVMIGEATKLAPFLTADDKAYEATLRLGVETDTGDAGGAVIEQRSVEGIGSDECHRAMLGFRGVVTQIPPAYSAVKHAGRPLYRYAREGKTVPRRPREVVIHELELLAFEPPGTVKLRMRCSKGTYVRALAVDLGRALGCGAHLTALRRTASGHFNIETAVPLARVLGEASAWSKERSPLITPAAAVAHMPAVTLDEATARAVVAGARLSCDAVGVRADSGEPVRLLYPSGALVAIVCAMPDGALKTFRVFRECETK